MVDTSLFSDDILSEDGSCNNNNNHVLDSQHMLHLGSSSHQQAMQQKQHPHPLALGGSRRNSVGHNSLQTQTSSKNSSALTNQSVSHHFRGVQTQVPTQELAFKLGNSVAVLQDFVMTIARAPDQQQEFSLMNPLQQQQQGGVGPQMTAPSTKVPSVVWEALAEVEAVRTILLQQQ